MSLKKMSRIKEVKQPLHPTEEIKRFQQKIEQIKPNEFSNLQEFLQVLDLMN